jgi:hypothetical protein
MARIRIAQNSFTGGQIDEGLLLRQDLEAYFKSVITATNVVVQPQGGLKRRGGFEYIATTNSSNVARLVEFEFNTEQKYLFVFTAGRLDVYADDALDDTITSSPISTITEAMLPDLNFAQTADTMYLVHEDLQPIKITRTGASTFSASSVTFSNIPTYDYGSGAEAVISATRGWPKTVAFYQGRLWLGGLKSRPQTMLGSKINSYEDLNEGTSLDDEAINITIDDAEVNAINGLFPGRHLQLFTTGGEYFIPQGVANDPITPSNITISKQTLHGSTGLRPVSVDGATLFYDGKDVREFIYNDVEQSYVAGSLSILSSGVLSSCTDTAIRRTTSTSNANYLYLVNSDGSIAVLNTLRNQKLTAWSKWTTDGTFEDIAVVGDDVYVVVNRTINSATVRYIEKLNEDHKTDASLIQTSGGATDSWSGLSHLEGETVKAIGDDFIMTDVTVASGAVTTENEVTETEFGINFAFTIKTVPADAEVSGDVLTGKRKRLVSILMRVNDTRSFTVNGYAPPIEPIGDIFDGTPTLTDDWVFVRLGGYDRFAQVTITQEEPLEFELYGFVLEVSI